MVAINTSYSNSASYYQSANQKAYNQTLIELASGSSLTGTDNGAETAVDGNLTASLDRLQAASQATQDTVSLAQTADGFLSTLQSGLTQLSVLAEEASSNVFGSAALQDYEAPFNDLLSQIDSITSNASFNGIPLFSNQTVSTAINADGSTDGVVLNTIGNVASLGLTGVSISTPASALSALTAVNAAIDCITNRRAQVDADISKFNFYSNNISTESLNEQSTLSTIGDVDVASASTQAASQDILSKLGIAVLAQSNTSQKNVLSLLTGAGARS